jgi:hypothetical protein
MPLVRDNLEYTGTIDNEEGGCRSYHEENDACKENTESLCHTTHCVFDPFFLYQCKVVGAPLLDAACLSMISMPH